MQRVAVVGSGGAGKSALARQIGAITGLPVIHLDHHYWGPGWVPTPNAIWVEHQRALLEGPRWVVNGNYGGTLELRRDPRRHHRVPGPAPAGLPVTRDAPGAVPILQAEGCPQKVDREFLRWIWAFPKDTRPKVLCILGRHAPTTDIVHLRSRAEVRWFPLPTAASERRPRRSDNESADPGVATARGRAESVHPR